MLTTYKNKEHPQLPNGYRYKRQDVIFKSYITFVRFVCECVCVVLEVCVSTREWRSEDSLWELVLSIALTASGLGETEPS